MKITKLNTKLTRIGILEFGEYQAPYVESTYPILNNVIQAFRHHLDTIPKLEELIVQSIELSKGVHKNNCIGENETLITYKDGFIQFYSITLSDDICLELDYDSWIQLLLKIKEFIVKLNL